MPVSSFSFEILSVVAVYNDAKIEHIKQNIQTVSIGLFYNSTCSHNPKIQFLLSGVLLSTYFAWEIPGLEHLNPAPWCAILLRKHLDVQRGASLLADNPWLVYYTSGRSAVG